MIPTPTTPKGLSKDEAMYRGAALGQLAILRNQLNLGGLKEGTRSVDLGNGVVVTCRISYNKEDIFVYVPTAEVPQEVVKDAVYGAFVFHVCSGEITTKMSYYADVYSLSQVSSGDDPEDGAYLCDKKGLHGVHSVPTDSVKYYTFNQNWENGRDVLSYHGSSSRYGLIASPESVVHELTTAYNLQVLVLGCAKLSVNTPDGVRNYIIYAYPLENTLNGNRICGFDLYLYDPVEDQNFSLATEGTPLTAFIQHPLYYPSVFFSKSGKKCCSVMGDKIVILTLGELTDYKYTTYTVSETPATVEIINEFRHLETDSVIAVDFIGEELVKRVRHFISTEVETGSYALGATTGEYASSVTTILNSSTSTVIGGVWDAEVVAIDLEIREIATELGTSYGDAESYICAPVTCEYSHDFTYDGVFIAHEDLRYGSLVTYKFKKISGYVTSYEGTYCASRSNINDPLYGNLGLDAVGVTTDFDNMFTYTKTGYGLKSPGVMAELFNVVVGPTKDDDFTLVAPPYNHLFTSGNIYAQSWLDRSISLHPLYAYEDCNVHVATHPQIGTLVSVLFDEDTAKIYAPSAFDYLGDASTLSSKAPLVEKVSEDDPYTLVINGSLSNISITYKGSYYVYNVG